MRSFTIVLALFVAVVIFLLSHTPTCNSTHQWRVPVQETSYGFRGHSPKSMFLLDPIHKALEELAENEEDADGCGYEQDYVQGGSRSGERRQIHSKTLNLEAPKQTPYYPMKMSGRGIRAIFVRLIRICWRATG